MAYEKFRFKEIELKSFCPFSKVNSQGQIGRSWRECGPWHVGPSSRAWLKNSGQPDVWSFFYFFPTVNLLKFMQMFRIQ